MKAKIGKVEVEGSAAEIAAIITGLAASEKPARQEQPKPRGRHRMTMAGSRAIGDCQRRRWRFMSPDERQARIEAMQAGKRKAPKDNTMLELL